MLGLKSSGNSPGIDEEMIEKASLFLFFMITLVYLFARILVTM